MGIPIAYMDIFFLADSLYKTVGIGINYLLWFIYIVIKH